MYRRGNSSYSRRSFKKRSVRRVGRRTSRTKRLVDGHSVLTKAERMIGAGASTAATVATLARNVGTIMSMINTEKKFVDTSFTAQPVDSAGTTNWLTPLAEGDTDQQRNGNQILASDLSIRFTVAYNPDQMTPTTVRVTAIVDKEYDGTLLSSLMPSAGQIFENGSNPLSAINKDFSKRFVILKTAVYNVNAQNLQIHDKLYMKVPFHVFYDGASASLTDAKENQIFLHVWSDADPITPASVSWYARVNYYDN